MSALVPIDCQADNVTFQAYDLNLFIATCGYRYDLPGEALIPLPPVVVVPTAPIPEPSSVALVCAGLVVIAAARWLRRKPCQD